MLMFGQRSGSGSYFFRPPPMFKSTPISPILGSRVLLSPPTPGRLLSAPRVLFGPGTVVFWTPEHCFSIPMNRKKSRTCFPSPPPPPASDSPVLPQQPQEIVCFPSIPPLAICLQPPLPGTLFLTSQHCFSIPMYHQN